MNELATMTTHPLNFKKHHQARWHVPLMAVLIVSGLFTSSLFGQPRESSHPAQIAVPPKGNLERLPDPRSLITGQVEMRAADPERFELPNGLRVLYLQDQTLPVFRATLAFKAGSLEDPHGQEGLASMTASLLRNGGSDRTFWSQLDTLLESKGATVEFQADTEFTHGKIHCFARDAEVVLGQVAGMLETPSFYIPRLEFIRGQMLAELKLIQDQPIQLAFHSFQAMLFDGSSFGRFPSETSLKNLSPNDCKTFAKTWFVPQQAVLAVSSPLSPEDAKKLLLRTLGNWAKGTGTAPTRPAHTVWAKPGVYVRPKANLTQAVVVIGLPWIKEDEPDSVALAAAMHVLGESGLGSRIFTSVRTREGLAYVAGSSHLEAIRCDGANMAFALTKAENADRCVERLKAEVERLVRDGPTQQELDATKRALTQSAVFDQVTPAEILDRAAKLAIFDRPADTYAKRVEKLQGLNLDEVHAAIKRHLKMEALRVFVLADPKTAHLEPLGAATLVK